MPIYRALVHAHEYHHCREVASLRSFLPFLALAFCSYLSITFLSNATYTPAPPETKILMRTTPSCSIQFEVDIGQYETPVRYESLALFHLNFWGDGYNDR